MDDRALTGAGAGHRRAGPTLPMEQPMSLYKTYQTDANLETKGVLFEPDTDTRIRVKRAGQTNPDYLKSLKKRTKPHQRAIENDTLPPEVDKRLIAEVYAESVIADWETNVDGEWKRGIVLGDGELHPFSFDNVVKILTDLPDLFADIQGVANRAAMYRKEDIEEAAKN